MNEQHRLHHRVRIRFVFLLISYTNFFQTETHFCMNFLYILNTYAFYPFHTNDEPNSIINILFLPPQDGATLVSKHQPGQYRCNTTPPPLRAYQRAVQVKVKLSPPSATTV